jgi:magnesium-transporting ATPase (P-type)
MKFRICCIEGIRYDFEDDKLYRTDADDQSKKSLVKVSKSPAVVNFLRILALCHSVQLMPIRRPSVDASTFELFPNKKKKKKLSSKIKNANSLFTIGSATPEPVTIGNPLGGAWEYQASSPDEKALLEACVK